MLIIFTTIVLVLVYRQTKVILYRNIIKFFLIVVPISLTLLYVATIANKWQLFINPYLIISNQLLVPNGIAIRALVDIFGLKSLFFIIASFLVLVILKVVNERLIRIISVVAIVFLVLVTLSIRYVQSEIRFNEHSQWAMTQLWVGKNTEFDAKFILDGDLDTYASWTTLTRRPRLTSVIGPQSIYLYTEETVALDLIRRRIGISPNVYSDAISLEGFYSNFSLIFGGDFLVRRSEWTLLKWEVIYQNSGYIIYKIPKLSN
jgi:hypothetical protein